MKTSESTTPDSDIVMKNKSNGTMTKTKIMLEVSSCFMAMVLAGVVLCFIGPIFPPEAEKRNIRPSEYAIVFSTIGITGIFTSIVAPVVLGKVGTKNGVVLGLLVNGVAVAAMGGLKYVEQKEVFLTVSVICRSVTGVVQVFITGGVPTLIATNYRDGAGVYVSLMQSGFGLGAGLGPFLGGLLYEIESFLLPFEFVGGLLVFMALVCAFSLRKTETSTENFEVLKTLRETGSLLKFPETWIGVGSISYVIAMETYLITTLEPHLRSIDISGSAVGGLFLVMFGAYCLSSPLWGKACDAGIPPSYCNVFGCLLVPVGMALIGPFPWISMGLSMWMVVVSLILIGIGMGANMGPSIILIQETALKNGYPDDVQTNAMVASLFSCAISLNSVIGPLMGGFLTEYFGFRKSTLSGIIMGFFIPVFVFFQSRKNDDEKEPSKQNNLQKTDLSKANGIIGE